MTFRHDLRVPVLLLALSGCADTDPLYRPGLWQASGANEANLVVQVANPGDLITGQGRHDADGQQATAAISRLRQDHVKSLLSDSTGVASSGNASTAAAPAPSIGGT